MEGDVFHDEHDTFTIRKQSSADQMPPGSGPGASTGSGQAAGGTKKNIIICDQAYPTSKDAPMFDHDKFFSCLKQTQGQDSVGYAQSTPRVWFGKYLMYGEVMESTNTILAR